MLLSSARVRSCNGRRSAGVVPPAATICRKPVVSASGALELSSIIPIPASPC